MSTGQLRADPGTGGRIRAIRAGRLIDGTGAPAIRDALVVLNAAGRITYAGPAQGAGVPLLDELPLDQVLHALGGTVLPGLIDTHVHLTFGVRIELGVPGQPVKRAG